MIRVTCSSCQKTFKVRDEFAGRKTKCPNCGAALSIDAAASDLNTYEPVEMSESLPPATALGAGSPGGLGQPSTPAGTSGLAITALVLAILGLCIPLIGLVALILGIMAVGQIDRSEGRLTGRGMATAAAIIGGIGMFLAGVALLIGILLPAIGAARRTSRQMQNSAQIRGVVQGCILAGQGNNNYFPGLSPAGSGTFAAVPGTYPVTASDQSVSNRFAILLNGSYFTPEYMRSPVETTYKTDATPGSAVTTDNFSYAMLQISGTDADAGRDAEWSSTINGMAAVMGDRANTIDNGLSETSIHVSKTTDAASSPHDWRGSVGFGDNHVEFMTSAVMPSTKYGRDVNTNDNLFSNDDGSSTVNDGSNALFIYN